MRAQLRVPIAVWLGLVVLAPLGGGDDGQDGNLPRPFLIALDAQTGEEVWRNESATSGVRRILGETKELAFAYDTACSRVGGPTTRGSVVAFDRETGEERWRRRIGVPPNLYSVLDFAVGGETIVVLGPDGWLRGLRPATGGVQWEQPIGELLPEVGSRDAVVLTSQPDITDPQARDEPGEVRAIDRTTGEVRWSYRQEGLGPLTQIETWIVGSGTAIVTFRPFGDPGGMTVALDVRTGTELWQVSPADRDLGAESGWSLLLGTSADGALVAYDPRTREQLWANSVPTGLVDVSGKLVLAQGGAENWLALDAETGNPRWAAARPGSPVALGRGTLLAYDGTPRGQVTALSARTGEIQWRTRAPHGGAKGWLAARNVYVSGGCLDADPM